MIITYFDRKDNFEVKTRKCYRIIPIAGGGEVICKSKDLDPIFILIEDIIYISEDEINKEDFINNIMNLFMQKGQSVGSRHGCRIGEKWLLDYDDIKEVIEEFIKEADNEKIS